MKTWNHQDHHIIILCSLFHFISFVQMHALEIHTQLPQNPSVQRECLIYCFPSLVPSLSLSPKTHTVIVFIIFAVYLSSLHCAYYCQLLYYKLNVFISPSCELHSPTAWISASYSSRYQQMLHVNNRLVNELHESLASVSMELLHTFPYSLSLFPEKKKKQVHIFLEEKESDIFWSE